MWCWWGWGMRIFWVMKGGRDRKGLRSTGLLYFKNPITSTRQFLLKSRKQTQEQIHIQVPGFIQLDPVLAKQLYSNTDTSRAETEQHGHCIGVL